MTAKPIVRISNKLVRASQKLRLSEKRLLMLAVSKIDDSNIDEIITVTATEYAAFYNVAKESSYSTMVAARDKLWERDFVIDDLLYRWVITCRYETGKGSVSIRMHPDLKEHIHDLKQCYTQYFLRKAGNFNRVYSWRLFELLMQFRMTGVLHISLAEFKEVLEIPKAYDRDFGLVRNKVITPSLKEIRDSGLPVKLKTEKRGRAIHMLRFTFPVEQQADFIDELTERTKPQRVTKAYIEANARPGESYSDAQERLQRELNQQKGG